MSAIIRKHYPVDRLPPDLRCDLPTYGWVDIEIRPETNSVLDAKSLGSIVGSGTNVHGDEEAVLEHLRFLRNDR